MVISSTKMMLLIALPYCIKKAHDGSYTLLNRDYKPLGFIDSGNIQYEDYPVHFRFARKLAAATVCALSWDGNNDDKQIFLYSDATVPFCGKEKDTVDYLKRLTRLATLRVSAVPRASD